MRRSVALLLLVASPLRAAEWEFSAPVELTDPSAPPHFHHLDGSGRQHVAVGGSNVAVVWEDDRSGSPQVYFAELTAGTGKLNDTVADPISMDPAARGKTTSWSAKRSYHTP